ncbi:hypothetical protein EHZ19_31655 [Paraburkholderia bannensis]|nr:hypothetical protein EHZ19_31655 [Paraburkholderia bannensis]
MYVCRVRAPGQLQARRKCIGSQINSRQIAADVGGNLNIVSVQDVTNSAAHQSSTGGGSASFSAQNGHADGSYAGVNEQAGINAGDGGFNVNVKGITGLAGGVISSTADESKNSLTTGTLTFSDIQNQSHYSANSNGISAGVGVGPNTGKAVGPGSVAGSGGVTPMVSQNESGDQSSTTRSAISAGTINVTNGAGQTQDIASLSRDTTNTNGTVSKTPDVNDILNQQADTMAAAQAAGQVVAQGVGAYADQKRDDAAAAYNDAYKRGDSEGMAAAAADYNNWKEGGDSRAELHAAGGALIGGLGGGGAFSTIGGAAGAGLASKMAGTLNDISKGVASATGSDLIGNLAANIAAGVGGAALGGTAGAAMASNVHLYNQTVDDERPLTGELGKKPLTLADYFMAGVKTALDLLPFGVGGGRPPAAGPGAVLVNGAGQALAAGISSSSTAAGYGPGNAIFNSGSDGNSSANNGYASNLENAANQPINDSGLSAAARAWDKHAGRPGGTFEPLSGSIAEKNAAAAEFVKKVLNDPSTTQTSLSRGGVEYRSPNGQGMRFNADGSFSGFLDPKK